MKIDRPRGAVGRQRRERAADRAIGRRAGDDGAVGPAEACVDDRGVVAAAERMRAAVGRQRHELALAVESRRVAARSGDDRRSRRRS